MNIVAWLIIGAVVGWAASLAWYDLEGILVNVLVSTCGAFIGGWLLAPTLAGDSIGSGAISWVGLVVAVLSAVVLLALVNLARLSRRR